MKFRIKNIALFLLTIIISLIIERAIPHSHVEQGDIIFPEFFQGESNSEDNDENHENGEKLHSSEYQLANFDYSFQKIFTGTIFWIDFLLTQLINNQKIFDYNILTKILSSLLFSVYIYSSKAPPLLIS